MDTSAKTDPTYEDNPARLTLGPVLFNWSAETWRDFYFRIADEAPVDTVVVGETVCAKRAPLYSPYVPDVLERLQAAGKETVLSSLALVMNPRELDEIRDLTGQDDFTVEANDVSTANLLTGRPHDIGPLLNVYNEATLAVFARRGARRVCLPVELGRTAYQALAAQAGAELEVMVFGRLPLAISARCYHARHHGLHKDNCQFVCDRDTDGLELETLDGEPFLAINGVQTLSYTYQNLIAELHDLQAIGIHRFRLSPHSADMVRIAGVFRAVLDHELTFAEAEEHLSVLTGDATFSNGYYYGHKGLEFTLPPES